MIRLAAPGAAALLGNLPPSPLNNEVSPPATATPVFIPTYAILPHSRADTASHRHLHPPPTPLNTPFSAASLASPTQHHTQHPLHHTHPCSHLGVTHILNAAEEVAPPPPSAGFTVLRVALRDTDDEDIGAHFEKAAAFIDKVGGPWQHRHWRCAAIPCVTLLCFCFLIRSSAATCVGCAMIVLL